MVICWHNRSNNNKHYTYWSVNKCGLYHFELCKYAIDSILFIDSIDFHATCIVFDWKYTENASRWHVSELNQCNNTLWAKGIEKNMQTKEESKKYAVI